MHGTKATPVLVRVRHHNLLVNLQLDEPHCAGHNRILDRGDQLLKRQQFTAGPGSGLWQTRPDRLDMWTGRPAVLKIRPRGYHTGGKLCEHTPALRLIA